MQKCRQEHIRFQLVAIQGRKQGKSRAEHLFSYRELIFFSSFGKKPCGTVQGSGVLSQEVWQRNQHEWSLRAHSYPESHRRAGEGHPERADAGNLARVVMRSKGRVKATESKQQHVTEQSNYFCDILFEGELVGANMF